MTDVVHAGRKSWRRLGVPDAIAAEMATELEAELAEAAADGVTPESFVGVDARSFAAQWAYSKGVVRSRARLLVTVLAAVAGAIPGTGSRSSSPTAARARRSSRRFRAFGSTSPQQGAGC